MSLAARCDLRADAHHLARMRTIVPWSGYRTFPQKVSRSQQADSDPGRAYVRLGWSPPLARSRSDGPHSPGGHRVGRPVNPVNPGDAQRRDSSQRWVHLIPIAAPLSAHHLLARCSRSVYTSAGGCGRQALHQAAVFLRLMPLLVIRTQGDRLLAIHLRRMWARGEPTARATPPIREAGSGVCVR